MLLCSDRGLVLFLCGSINGTWGWRRFHRRGEGAAVRTGRDEDAYGHRPLQGHDAGDLGGGYSKC
jgi:hypothetical protein